MARQKECRAVKFMDDFNEALRVSDEKINSDLNLLDDCGVSGVQIVSHDWEPLRRSLTLNGRIVRDYYIEFKP